MEKVGLLNFPGHLNHGANLTAYALQRAVSRMGYYAANLHLHDNNAVEKRPQYTDFADKNIRMTEVESWGEYGMQRYNKEFDTYIVGSDQVWRYIDGEYMFAWKTHHEPCFYLGFAAPGKRRIAMAASFGRDDYNAPEPVRKRCAEELKRFAAISVREKSAVKLVREIADVEVEQVIDPVFYMSAEEWNEFATPVQEGSKGSFVAYNSFFSGETIEELERELAEGQRLVPLLAGDTSEWLGNIRDARFVISDSYHVCCFCLIYGTPFVALSRKDQGKARFDELAEYFGFSPNRIIDTTEVLDLPAAIRKVMELPHDPQAIWNKIAEGKEKSFNWLKNALTAPVPEWSGSAFRKASFWEIWKEKRQNLQYKLRKHIDIRYYAYLVLYYTCPFKRTRIRERHQKYTRIKHNYTW